MVEPRNSIDDPLFKRRRYAPVSEIAVLGEYQGLGIGRLSMERIQQWIYEQEITQIELQVWERNTQAIGFHKKLGYQTWQRTMLQTIDRRLNT